MRSLFEKYRPKIFSDLVGQDHISTYLSNLIKQGPLARNIVFYGPWGSGKTTGARLYARALNCNNPISGNPCNSCNFCVDHINGVYPECLEFDGATVGRIEYVRDLKETALQPPILGNFRVIQIEEAQGLSNQSWDVLLKLIEEPPPYLVFLCTTTELNKVRPAIKSRCQLLELKLLDHPSSVSLLIKVASGEGIEYEDKALDVISDVSKGHSRDLIKNLEQVSWMGGVSFDNVCLSLNLEYMKRLPELIGAFDESMELVRNCLISWPASPKDAHDKILQYLLLIFYIINGVSVDSYSGLFGRMGGIDVSDSISVLDRISARFSSGTKGILSEVLTWSSQFEVSSLSALEIWGFTVFNYFHNNKSEGSLGKVLGYSSSDDSISLIKRKSRPMRSNSYNLDNMFKSEKKKEDSVSAQGVKQISLGDDMNVVPGEWNTGGFKRKV